MKSHLLLASLLAIHTLGCYASHDMSGDSSVVRPTPVTMPCAAGGGGSTRDCGFRVDSNRTCIAGRPVQVGCGCEGLGSCVGDPVLRICAGDIACTSAASLSNVDDRCGLCPAATFVCPAEGRYTILTAPYSSGSSYTCSVGIR